MKLKVNVTFKNISFMIFFVLTICLCFTRCYDELIADASKTLARRKMTNSSENWQIERLKSGPEGSDGEIKVSDENIGVLLNLAWDGGYYDRTPHARVYLSAAPTLADNLSYYHRKESAYDFIISFNCTINNSEVRWNDSGPSLHEVIIDIYYTLTATIQHVSPNDFTCELDDIETDTIKKRIHKIYDIPQQYFINSNE